MPGILLKKDDPYPSAPRIPIIVKGCISFGTLGILDSGATESFLPSWIAKELELPAGQETRVKLPNGMGKGLTSKLTIRVDLEHESVELKLPCIILEGLEEIVLGRLGFFESFDITFRERKKEIVLKYLGKKL